MPKALVIGQAGELACPVLKMRHNLTSPDGWTVSVTKRKKTYAII